MPITKNVTMNHNIKMISRRTRMFQYENYLLEKDHLSFEEALEIYTQLLNQMDFEDEDMAELFQDVVEAAVKYVTMRNAWLTFSNEEKKEKYKNL